MTRRALLPPEVVQTSAMDCGPATLASVLGGFGIPASVGRLREACQTEVDGTSIDVLEDVARRLGLDAEQVLLPLDHVLEPATAALPAIAVVVQPDRSAHFVVAWRVVGPFVLVMDPGTGLRLVERRRFLAELYTHAQEVPAVGWRAWAAEAEVQATLRARLGALGARDADALLARANADPGWRGLAALDAATRTVAAVVWSGGVARGAEAERLVAALAADPGAVPASSWSVTEAEDDALVYRGAVLVRVKGRLPEGPAADLPPELVATLREPAPRPLSALGGLVRGGGWLLPGVLSVALVVATFGGMVQTVLLRGLLELAGQLGLLEQRLVAVAAIGVFALGLLLVELPIAGVGLAMGRALEYRLRAAFLRKIPRLGDRYLQSRPTSDMAQRSHSVHVLRTLPEVAARLARAVLRLGATAAGLVWLDPGSLPAVLVATFLCVGIPLATQGPLAELDLRFRTHAGSLARFYLDAMLGLVAVRTHGAERSLRRAHEALLTEWARAGRASLGVVVAAETVQGLVAFGLSVWLFAGWLGRAGDAAAALLVAYWALELPTIGVEIGGLARLWPPLRNVTLRLVEPLGAREEGADAPSEGPVVAGAAGVAVGFAGVSVRAGGHTLLEGVDL
ncbi:MAG: cysteine peptidase family C39 domain-containing protein, partial [Myxococcota bacterium]